MLPYLIVLLLVGASGALPAQTPSDPPNRERPATNQPPSFPGGRGGFGPGRGGMGGVQAKMTIVEQFDKDGDHRLNAAEREAARAFLAKQGTEGRGGFRGPRGFGGGGNQEPAQPGIKLSPAEVKSYPNAPLYEPTALRTFFLEFEEADWEKELAEFKNTDVQVPAKLMVDGKTYPEVGVRFRGTSSFMMIPEGRKRSLNLSLDFAHPQQELGGYRTLNLLNSNDDPTFLHCVLFCLVARDYVPAPKANFVRVVINGENWGIYPNIQQCNKDFVKEWFGTTKGARWKVPGSPNGQGGLSYLGDEVAPYKRIYELKTKEDPQAWADFIKLCQVLNQTPVEKLEAALAPLLDIDGALKFLALDNVFVNGDGFWTRASDYYLYQDVKGRFHLIPNDINETFSSAQGGPGRRGGGRGFGGPGGGGVELDPLISLNDANKPLLSKLLAVPSLRQRYLGCVREIAEKWLNWNKLGPIVQQYDSLIAEDVKRDTRKIYSTEAFVESGKATDPAAAVSGSGRQESSLKSFIEKRQAYLLNHAEVKKARF